MRMRKARSVSDAPRAGTGPAQPEAAYVRVRNLRLEFSSRAGPLTVFDDLNLDVKAGEFCCVIGPSGCGKSSLLRIIDGLSPPGSGEVLVGGRPVTGPSLGVGFVFQQFNLLPWRTLLDNVRLGLENLDLPRKEQRDRARHWLSVVGLERFEKYYPSQVSGGMQQRANLARALAIDPELLLMDEPFGSVDAQTRMRLQSEVLRIWERQHNTVIFVTHDIEEALYLGDYVVVLAGRPARIVETLEVPFPRPRSDETRGDPRIAALKRRLWALLQDPEAGGSGAGERAGEKGWS
jgi:NitT/TauT family transport system ATP-binding protein